MAAKIISTNAKPIPALGNSARANLSPPTARLLGTASRSAFNEPLTVAGGVCRKCRSSFPSGVSAEGCCARCRLIANYAQWTSAGKLSEAAWERTRRLLLIGGSLQKLSDGKTTAAAAVLTAFIEQFPIDEQIHLTEIQIAEWLLAADSIILPPSFRKAVAAGLRRIVRQTRSAPHVEPHGEIFSTGSFPNDLPDTAHQTNKTGGTPKRRPISKMTFLKLAARQGMCCHWCRVPVVRQSLIAVERRLRQNKITLSYRDESGNVRRGRAATVDHLRRVADGGDNQLSNLVISCFPCNLKRERELRRRSREALKKLPTASRENVRMRSKSE